MDADSGRILFEKNGYEQRPMASTTKIMTLIVAVENLSESVSLSYKVTVSSAVYEAMRLAGHKLPIKTKFVRKEETVGEQK